MAIEWKLNAPAYAARTERVAVAAPTWAAAGTALAVVIWGIPIKSYKLPVALPFNLEIYRLLIVVLLGIWLLSIALGRGRVSAAGHGTAAVMLALSAFAALFVNRGPIAEAGLQTQAVKSLSFFVTYIVAFVLLASTLDTLGALEKVAKAVAGCGSLVAVAAIVESRTHYNVFEHLHGVIPFLIHIGKERTNFTGGALRVRASAQHPIALGAALMMTVPLSLHFARAAARTSRRRLWYGGAALAVMGALATGSRTAIAMLATMLLASIWLYGRRILRYWPVLIVFVAITHVAAPGVVSHMYHRFDPKGGLIKQQQTRAGQSGSGRLADLAPGIDRFRESPLFGYGLGTVSARGDAPSGRLDQPAMHVSIIFDDQYMNTLVTLGAFGFATVVWFVWGAFLKTCRAAKRARGRPGADLLAACGISCAGFAIGMFTFDAFSFVQATLVFFVIASLGLSTRRLVRQ